ncbi:hypothetical protein D3C71_1303970 [compost metagenome]
MGFEAFVLQRLDLVAIGRKCDGAIAFAGDRCLLDELDRLIQGIGLARSRIALDADEAVSGAHYAFHGGLLAGIQRAFFERCLHGDGIHEWRSCPAPCDFNGKNGFLTRQRLVRRIALLCRSQ